MRSGLLVLPLVVAEGLANGASGWLIHLAGRYIEQIWVGTLLLTIGTRLLIRLDLESTLAEIIMFQIIGGAGSALLFEPPLIALQSLIVQEDTASGKAMLGFIRTMPMSISVVVGGVVFQNRMKDKKSLLQHAGLMESQVDQLTGASAAASTEIIQNLSDPEKVRAVADASSSFRNIWIMFSCVAGLAIIASAFITKQPLSVEHTETRIRIEGGISYGVHVFHRANVLFID